MSSTSENMVNININPVDDIESNTVSNEKITETLFQVENISRFLREEEDNRNKSFEIACIKFVGIIIILLILAPLSVADLYYAYTDDSCVHQSAGNLNVNLFTYLAVDGILGGAGIIGLSLYICLMGENTSSEYCKGCCMLSMITLCGLFTLAWTIVGSIIFWSLIDNEECSKGVYNYVFALLIIRYVSILVNLCAKNNDKK
jgi:hypothetical protein